MARQPTSHERRAGQPWDASYLDGPAPWDIGGRDWSIASVSAERIQTRFAAEGAPAWLARIERI